MMRDITDFSARDSKAFNENVSLYEDALNETDASLLNFDEARRMQEDIPTEFKAKTHNSSDFLNEARLVKRKMNTNTNAVMELLESKKDELKENLKYGATPEELEEEVRGDFGREILEVCQSHNITGEAIWDAIEILKAIIGEEPDVDEAIENWATASEGDDAAVEADTDGEGDESDDESDDELEESAFPKTLEEMTKLLRKRIAEKQIAEKAGLKNRRLNELFGAKNEFQVYRYNDNYDNWDPTDARGRPNVDDPVVYKTRDEAKDSEAYKNLKKRGDRVKIKPADWDGRD